MVWEERIREANFPITQVEKDFRTSGEREFSKKVEQNFASCFCRGQPSGPHESILIFPLVTPVILLPGPDS